MKIHLSAANKDLVQQTGYVQLDFPSEVPNFCNQEFVSLLDLPLVYAESDGQLMSNHCTLRDYWKGQEGKGIQLKVNSRSWNSNRITVLNGTLEKFDIDDIHHLLAGFPFCLDLEKSSDRTSRLCVVAGALIMKFDNGDKPQWVAARLVELKKKPMYLH